VFYSPLKAMYGLSLRANQKIMSSFFVRLFFPHGKAASNQKISLYSSWGIKWLL